MDELHTWINFQRLSNCCVMAFTETWLDLQYPTSDTEVGYCRVTSDFRYCSQSCQLQKFSDDSAIVGCIRTGQESEYRSVVDIFMECELNHLQLSIAKTKELVVDFRKQPTHPKPVSIRGTEADIVEEYKYLGVHIDNNMDWTKNTEALYKKGQSRLYFLRTLRSFNICKTMLQMFYHLVVASIIFYAVVCLGNRVKAADANRLNKLIRKAGAVLGVELESVVEVLCGGC